MKPTSAMRFKTYSWRSLATEKFWVGEKRLGALGRPASMAPWARLSSVDVLVEVGPSGGLNPIGAGSEVNLVQVEIEDFVFAQSVVNAIGQDGLFQFAHIGLFGRKQERFDHLLGDGASPLHDFPGFKILQ